MKGFIKIYSVLVVFTYLLLCFGLWEIDASKWNENLRMIFAYLSVTLLPMLSNLFYVVSKDCKTSKMDETNR